MNLLQMIDQQFPGLLPEEESAEGTQRVAIVYYIEGRNDMLKEIKHKLGLGWSDETT